MVLVNDCHSDASLVNNSDSGAFRYFFRITHFCMIFDLCSIITERLAGKVTALMNYIYRFRTLFCVKSTRLGFAWVLHKKLD